MIGLVLVTHAGLAGELKRAAEMIVGKIERVETVDIGPEDSVEKIRDSIAAAINAVTDSGVVIMTDMFGGTPSNMSLSFLEENKVEVLTGVNLPMMIKFATEREKSPLPELARLLRDRAREGILVAGEYLKK
jgi:PTS system mannose-specific IIA component